MSSDEEFLGFVLNAPLGHAFENAEAMRLLKLSDMPKLSTQVVGHKTVQIDTETRKALVTSALRRLKRPKFRVPGPEIRMLWMLAATLAWRIDEERTRCLDLEKRERWNGATRHAHLADGFLEELGRVLLLLDDRRDPWAEDALAWAQRNIS